jgi:RNA polymerase-binding transcription factor DksA
VPNDAAIADLRASLELEQMHLRQQLADLGLGSGGTLAFDHNFADSSQVTAERAEAEALGKSLQDTLAEVDAALGKLDAGTFGQCERCGQEIAPARLEAKPAARLCIECAARR